MSYNFPHLLIEVKTSCSTEEGLVEERRVMVMMTIKQDEIDNVQNMIFDWNKDSTAHIVHFIASFKPLSNPVDETSCIVLQYVTW